MAKTEEIEQIYDKEEICMIGTKGEGKITWPGKLTAEEYEDLEYWLTAVLRKAKRSIYVPLAPLEEE